MEETQNPSAAQPMEDIQELTTLHERAIAALGYAGFFAIVPFYLKKDSKFCRYHGKQAMLLALVFFMAKLVLVIDLFDDLAKIVQFYFFLSMGFAALSGKWKKLPFGYGLACQLEDSLALKTKDEEQGADRFRPDEVPNDENQPTQ